MENSIWGDLRSNSPAIFLRPQQPLLILPKFSSIFPLLLLLLLLQSHLLQTYIMYRSLFSLSPQDHKMEKDGFHTLPPPKRHRLLLLFQTHLLSLRKNEPIPARKRPLPPPPPTVFLRRSASGLPTLSSPLSTPPPRTNPRLPRQRDSPVHRRSAGSQRGRGSR